MAQFTSFQNILPDPNNSIGDAEQSTGSSGAGFREVTFSGEQPYMSSRTNSGRLLARATAAHKWKIKITYNPMTRRLSAYLSFLTTATRPNESFLCFFAPVSNSTR